MTSTFYQRPEDHIYLDVPIVDAHHRVIIDRMIEYLGLKAGDHVAELGAGSGRYSKLLRDAGIKVTAFEPDPYLAKKARASFEDDPDMVVVESQLAPDTLPPEDCIAVVGFHVLHHLNLPALTQLKSTFNLLEKSHAFKGWVFLEPNPLNILWHVLIWVTKGQSYNEERGIWLNDYNQSLGNDHSVFQGDVGFFPPREQLKGLAGRYRNFLSDISRKRSPLRIYRIFGQCRNDSRR